MPETADLARRFGERVRALRRARGISRDNLAASIGVRPTALARMERGERFNCANLAPLATALHVEVRDLFDFGQEAPHPEIASILALLRVATPDQLAVAERLLRALLSQ